MILVDTVLRLRNEVGNPIRVGMIGAGFQARGIARRLPSGRLIDSLHAEQQRVFGKAGNAEAA